MVEVSRKSLGNKALTAVFGDANAFVTAHINFRT